MGCINSKQIVTPIYQGEFYDWRLSQKNIPIVYAPLSPEEFDYSSIIWKTHVNHQDKIR